MAWRSPRGLNNNNNNNGSCLVIVNRLFVLSSKQTNTASHTRNWKDEEQTKKPGSITRDRRNGVLFRSDTSIEDRKKITISSAVKIDNIPPKQTCSPRKKKSHLRNWNFPELQESQFVQFSSEVHGNVPVFLMSDTDLEGLIFIQEVQGEKHGVTAVRIASVDQNVLAVSREAHSGFPKPSESFHNWEYSGR